MARRPLQKKRKMPNRQNCPFLNYDHTFQGYDIRAFYKALLGGLKVLIEPLSHEGIFIAECEEYGRFFVTKNLLAGQIEEGSNKGGYRVWNPFRSKLGAAIYAGIRKTWIKPGARVLYLGAGSGKRKTVSHVSDIVDPAGVVYAVESKETCWGGLVDMASKRTNIIPILKDARQPDHYSDLVGTVDVILCDVAQPDQASILKDNASCCLKTGGHFLTSIKASRINSTAPPFKVFLDEVDKLDSLGFGNLVLKRLEPFMEDCACVVGSWYNHEEMDSVALGTKILTIN